MTTAERRTFAALPAVVTVYRGFSRPSNRDGWSWTLDRRTAEWFARRVASLGGKASPVEGRVRRSKVLAYLNARREREVVVRPEDVHVARTVRLAGLDG